MSLEFHPGGWDILFGLYPAVWSFGVYLEVGRAEQEFRLGLGPLDLYVRRAS